MAKRTSLDASAIPAFVEPRRWIAPALSSLMVYILPLCSLVTLIGGRLFVTSANDAQEMQRWFAGGLCLVGDDWGGDGRFAERRGREQWTEREKNDLVGSHSLGAVISSMG